jgi:hypothetical protein
MQVIFNSLRQRSQGGKIVQLPNLPGDGQEQRGHHPVDLERPHTGFGPAVQHLHDNNEKLI